MELSGTTVTMQGYVSRFAGGEEWPDTYVIVRVEPEDWMATLELNELRAVVDGRDHGPVRGVRCEWIDGLLRLRLGPAHVQGRPQDWLRLAARVRDHAGSAESLYDVPRAWPWDGPVTPIHVDDVVVPGSPGAFDRVELTGDELLARAGGFDSETWRETFGTGWRDCARSVPQEDSLGVYLWGEPAQLAATVATDGGLLLGRPGGRWEGVIDWWWDVIDPVRVSAEQPPQMIDSFVRDLLRRRRRGFSWCRYCGSHLAPEGRLETDLCYGCASNVLGVVY